jgi:hypothetical protein
MNNILFIIDCDNFSYNNFNNAVKKIKNEFHNIPHNIDVVFFGNFTNKLKNRWNKTTTNSEINNKTFYEIPILKKKNITDHFIIVEISEILFTSTYDIFIFASDDVDFIPLYGKLKKYNKKIWQISQNRELNSLTDDFIDKKINIFLEDLENSYCESELIELIKESISNNTKFDGVCYLGDVKYWLDINKNFSLEKTKFKKFSRLINALKIFEINKIGTEMTIKIKD